MVSFAISLFAFAKGFHKSFPTCNRTFLFYHISGIFSIKNVEKNGPKKQVKILGLRFNFKNKLEIIRREFADLRWRIDKVNNQLEKIQNKTKVKK